MLRGGNLYLSTCIVQCYDIHVNNLAIIRSLHLFYLLNKLTQNCSIYSIIYSSLSWYILTCKFWQPVNVSLSHSCLFVFNVFMVSLVSEMGRALDFVILGLLVQSSERRYFSVTNDQSYGHLLLTLSFKNDVELVVGQLQRNWWSLVSYH